MSNKNDGGQAFPGNWNTCGNQGERGMTLRDYFAAKALAGFSANPSMIDSNDSKAITYMAACSYEVADAMLAERAK